MTDSPDFDYARCIRLEIAGGDLHGAVDTAKAAQKEIDRLRAERDALSATAEAQRAEIERLTLRWTTVAPTQTGRYYYRFNSEHSEWIGSVWMRPDGELCFKDLVHPLQLVRLLPGEWAGPIPLPAEPEGMAKYDPR